jgi:hypothetical protein
MLQYFVSTDPEEARYKLYRIVGKIIVNSDSNN